MRVSDEVEKIFRYTFVREVRENDVNIWGIGGKVLVGEVTFDLARYGDMKTIRKWEEEGRHFTKKQIKLMKKVIEECYPMAVLVPNT